MKLIVTGACGYKGNVLVPKLLNAGHHVTALDIMWFGNDLQPHPNLEVRQFDIRDPEDLDLAGYDAIIHLSSVANDPCGDLDPKLTWEVSCLATMRLADKAVRQGVKRFIYASSGSVYGLKDEEHVTEDLELVPLSEYNKTKMCGERIVLSYKDDMAVQIVRPATVCGYSRRQRMDLVVNILVNHAVNRGVIKVFGGDQYRPNLHIDDMCRAYECLLEESGDKIQGQIFNVGGINHTVSEIAQIVQDNTPGESIVKFEPTDDNRSYRISSRRIAEHLGFVPRKGVDDAVRDLVVAFEAGLLRNSMEDSRYFNIKRMNEILGASSC